MKSYWIVTKGRQATLERREVPIPQPQPGQIVIAVRASALNRGELFVGGVVHGGPENSAAMKRRASFMRLGPV